jgi:AraC-like DNA-binding protein
MDKRIERAYDIIKRHYHEKLLLKKIAFMVGVSPFHFQRLFKKEMSESPAECMARVRLERAVHLMALDPGISISSLAERSGFSSLAIFSRAFSKRYGRSPKVFQQGIQFHHLPQETLPFTVDVVQSNTIHVLYEHTNMYKEKLEKDFEKVKIFAKRKKITTHDSRLGIITHIGFHGPKRSMNYYAGVEISADAMKGWEEFCYTIPRGKYASFMMTEPHADLLNILVRFKHHWLDRSQYLISEIFAFEKWESDESRRIYVPVKRKTI